MRALIFAAGLGTRLKPLTDTMPKALVPVGGQPLLYHVLQKLKGAGIRAVTVNVHHFADQILAYLASQPVGGLSVTVSDERDFLRETGGGIRFAEPLLVPDRAGCRSSSGAAPASVSGGKSRDAESAPAYGDGAYDESSGRFLVHNVDILSNLDLDWFAARMPSAALAALAVSDRKTQRYFLFREESSAAENSSAADPEDGVSGSSGSGEGTGQMLRLVGWTNVATGEVRTPFPDLDVAACRKLAFSGIHLISDRIFDVFRAEDRDSGGNGPGQAPLGERFSITDFYLRVCADYPIYGIVPPDFRMIDVGKLVTLRDAEDFLRKFVV